MEKLLSVPKFHSKDEEVQYWTDMAHKIYQKQEDMKRELEEYQESSIILERELETSYEQSVVKNRDLQLANNKLAQENEHLKARLSEQVTACTGLQCKVQHMRNVIDEMSGQIRKLEQENDDLERANRELKVSEEATEEQFNDVIEKLALLETEIEEKEGLQIIIQRLKDENKDLKQQIEVDLRKTHGSPLTRIRKMSMVRRQQRRNSAESEKSLSVHEETPDFHRKNDKDNLLEYISELEREINCLKKNKRTSKVIVVDVATESNITLDADFFLGSKLDEDEERSIPDYILQSIENNKEQSQEAQVRLRSPRGVSVDRAPRPLSFQSKAQDENARTLATSRTNRILENRVKKVKDEEKRQNLMHFLKRFRYRQPSWLRKKH